MKHNCVLAGLVCLTSMHSAAVSAQVERISLQLGDIGLGHVPAPAGAVPLQLDLKVAVDGDVTLRIPGVHKVSDVTLKRGVVGSEPPSAWLSFVGAGEDGQGDELAIGEFLFALPGRGSAAAQIELPSGSNDEEAVVFVADAHPGTVIRLRFDPAPGRRLFGSPAALFMPAMVDAPLIAEIPMPPPGQAAEVLLMIASSTGQAAALGTKVRVKIKHSI